MTVQNEAFFLPEYFYGDLGPSWTEGRKARPCMCKGQAQLAKYRLAWVMRKHRGGEEKVDNLAKLLLSCIASERCNSGACPECMRAMQRFFVSEAQRLMLGNRQFCCVSVVPTKEDGAKSGLTAKPGNVKKRMEKAFEAAGVSVAFGAMEFSFNEVRLEDGSISAKLAAHAYCFAPYEEVGTGTPGRESLRQSFPAMPLAPRPVQVKWFDGDSRALAYAYKSKFTRRVAIPKVDGPDGVALKRRNTRARELRANQKIDLAILLDDLGLLGRFVLRGVKIVPGPQMPRLVLTRRFTRVEHVAQAAE